MNKENSITVTGVDMGSAGIKIAAVVKGAVDVIVNEANMRETPNIVGFGEKQRQIGESGKLKIKSNYSNTVTSPSRLLGFHFTCPYTNLQLNFTPAKLQKPFEQVVFSLLCGKKEKKIIAQQLVGGLITEVQMIVSQTNNFQNNNMVIAVPGYLTQHQRKSMMDAVQIARKGVKNDYPIQLVDQQIAASMDYGYNRISQFSSELSNPKNVLFIDLGHSKTNIFLTSFNKQHFRILTTDFDRQLGCKFMDWEILKFYASQFESKNTKLSIPLIQSKKAIQKLLQRIQKQRKTLSAVNDADINVQCLLEGEDFYYTLTRQKFQEICSSIFERFQKLLERFFNFVQQKGILIDSVELIGGGTRIPTIINAIKKVFGKEPSRTLNSSQCIAKGAALVSAVNSNIFRARPFNFIQSCKYNVNLIVNGVNQGKRLLKRNEILYEKNKIIQIQIQVGQNLQKLVLMAQYDLEQIEKGLQTKIFEVQIGIKQKKKSVTKKIKNKEMKQEIKQQQNLHKVQLHFIIDSQSSLIKFTKVTSQSLTVQTKKIQDFEYLSKQKLSLMENFEKQMTVRDLKIRRFYQIKNEFESKCYKLREQIDDYIEKYKEYFQEKKEKQLRKMIENKISNLQNMEMDYIERIDELNQRKNKLCQKSEQFIKQIESLKTQYDFLNNELKELSCLIQNLISTRNQHDYPKQVNQTGEWINSVFQKLQQQPKYLSPPITTEEVKYMKNQLQNQVKLFDKQVQRKKTLSSREGIKTRQQNEQQNPTQTFFKPQTSCNSSIGQPSRSYYSPFDSSKRSHYNPGKYLDRRFF